MSKQGRLTLEKCGYSMPADAPAYQRPPFYYKDSHAITVVYETDTESALNLLPEPLTLPEPATAALSFNEYRWSTFGAYNEVILSLMVEHRGRALTYIAHIAVTTEPPMLGGREIWGYSKKLAVIDIKHAHDMIYGTLERPPGVRLASVVMRPEQPAAAGHVSLRPVSLRLIPSPEQNAESPTCADLIEAEVEQRIIEAWTGTGSIAFAETSALDPWNTLPVRKVFSATHTIFDLTLGWGKIIDRLRAR